jgi:uncharacterized membrane protein YfcA
LQTIYIFLLFGALFTAIFSAVFGVAGGMMLFVLLTLFLDAKNAVPMHAIVQLVSNFSRVVLSLKHIKKAIVWRFVLLTPLGAYLGALIFEYTNPKIMEIVIGSAILAMLYLIPNKNAKNNQEYTQQIGQADEQVSKPNYNSFILLGFLSSFLGMIVGVVGPFISPFFIRQQLKKEELVATKAACQGVVQLVKVPTFGLVVAFDYEQYSLLISLLCLVTVLGTWVGKNLIHRISDKNYHFLEKIILTVLSLFMIGKAAKALLVG